MKEWNDFQTTKRIFLIEPRPTYGVMFSVNLWFFPFCAKARRKAYRNFCCSWTTQREHVSRCKEKAVIGLIVQVIEIWLKSSSAKGTNTGSQSWKVQGWIWSQVWLDAGAHAIMCGLCLCLPVSPYFCLALFCRLGCIHLGLGFCITYLPQLSIQTSLQN